ncbi:unnamed protein product [Moneuplotes crassus]|uniref:Uncharacterized protein n=1 Tax=Euplotes crassus TaxID=5936 RepID=A0AAD1Y7K3_EUPCR|nr:unnamed protein product [Moneuplotes crassus]
MMSSDKWRLTLIRRRVCWNMRKRGSSRLDCGDIYRLKDEDLFIKFATAMISYEVFKSVIFDEEELQEEQWNVYEAYKGNSELKKTIHRLQVEKNNILAQKNREILHMQRRLNGKDAKIKQVRDELVRAKRSLKRSQDVMERCEGQDFEQTDDSYSECSKEESKNYKEGRSKRKKNGKFSNENCGKSGKKNGKNTYKEELKEEMTKLNDMQAPLSSSNKVILQIDKKMDTLTSMLQESQNLSKSLVFQNDVKDKELSTKSKEIKAIQRKAKLQEEKLTKEIIELREQYRFLKKFHSDISNFPSMKMKMITMI